MNENTKVAIKVEYERDGVRKVCYGEIDENKLDALEESENFDEGEDNYILIENDGEPNWKEKVSVISVERMGVTSTVFDRRRNAGSLDNTMDTGICS